MSYTSDLTDQEWSIVEPLLLEYLLGKKRTCPLKWSYREIFDAVLYQLKNGCNWRDLPKDFLLTQQFTGITSNGERAD